ncbi:MAG: phosphatase, partial [Actinobacteria bacterium]
LGLVATGGSDYHGAGKPGIHLGTGKGDLSVPDDVLEQLRERR